MHFRALLLVFCLSLALHADAKPPVDFSHYDVPVYEQIVNRIKAKISERLGQGPNTHERYFIIPFAYEDEANSPEYSHSFITVVRVLADHKQARLTQGLALRKYKNREFEAFTISWLPHDFKENPNLCVFSGFGARIFPKNNQCPVVVGKNFNLQDTIGLGSNVKNAICMWGPYEIQKPGFDLGVKRMRLLDTGVLKYRADDRGYRADKVAINCFHAIAGLDQLFPNGGIFGTGFKMWGLNGTARVLIEYTEKPAYKKLFLEPVDYKKDRYAFVYAPSRDARGIYQPVKNASAYHR